jgi:transcriptional/translational regulatory protein YebC/TACO1
MSHSKFAKNVGKKAKTGAQKSKLFTKAVKLIMQEARASNGNREAYGLKRAIEKAKEVEMPADNIERAIKKATEEKNNLESITYEAYGTGGVQLVIEALTENRNKAAQEVRAILSKNGCSLAGVGAVTWAFTKKGMEWIPNEMVTFPEGPDGESLEKILEEFEDNDEVQEVFTNLEVVEE